MGDVGRGNHAKGMLTTRGSGVGSDFQPRSMAETVRGPAWAQIGQAVGCHDGQVKDRGQRQEGTGGALQLILLRTVLWEMQGEATHELTFFSFPGSPSSRGAVAPLLC